MIAGKRVLIIEDEFLVAAMLADALEDAGAVTLGPAASHADGLRMVNEGGFDVAVVDWNLDGQRSDAIARTLNERQMPFVISTGYGSVGPEFAHIPALPKPYAPDQLVALLGRVLTA